MSLEHIVFVQPGEVHWSEQPCIFKTILGSCVAVCLWDHQLGIGGINHFILPRARNKQEDARFGDVAIPLLVQRLRSLNCSMLVAKVFGGAAVLASANGITVGDSNIEAALDLLATDRIPVIAQRTGGTQGVVLRFLTATGEVQLRLIREKQLNEIS